ncbi:MAG: prepilin-type N-terminal cleavage/methylation domain-containing protein, partial [Pyrinomonadaceae bacterium]
MNDNTKTTAGQSVVRSRSESGFSLLEVLVSMILFLIVTASIWGVLRAAQLSRQVVNQQVGLSKNVRIGLNLIGRDTYNAGYGYPLKSTVILPDNRISTLLGIPNDLDSSRDTVAPIVAGNNITLSTFNTTPGVYTDQITFLYKDSTFNLVGAGAAAVSQPLNINAATTTGGGIDEIIPLSGTNSACRANDIFLVTGNAGSTLGVATALSGANAVQFGNADILGFNQTGATGTLRSIVTPASMTRVKMLTYFVSADGTLTRREFATFGVAAPFVDEPMVYGVEDFQIQYVMDDG